MATEELVFKHCNLPIDCPASCSYLREVPISDLNEVVSFCIEKDADNPCPFSVDVEHQITYKI
jgi:hypothetical protein